MIIVEKSKDQLVIGTFLPVFAFILTFWTLLSRMDAIRQCTLPNFSCWILDRGVESPQGFNGIP